MCGRYTLFTSEEYAEIVQILHDLDRNDYDNDSAGPVATGEIFPTNRAPILISGQNTGIRPEAAIWGYPGFSGKGVIINARAESAPAKPMFQRSVHTRRCVVPSTGFYEWDKAKQKFLFQQPDSGALYMAGLYNDFQGERRYVILTTSANPSVADVHNRMPIVLPRPAIEPWLGDTKYALEVLQAIPPMLVRQPATN